MERRPFLAVAAFFSRLAPAVAFLKRHAERIEKMMGLLTPTLSMEDLADCDLVIEAVYESMDVKKDVFGKLDKICKAGAILANWDPLTRPIITEFAGQVRFENVEEGLTVAKQVDDVTGLSTLVVIDPKRRGAAKVVRPQVKLIDAQGNEVKIPGTDHSVTIGFQVGALIQVRDGQDVGPGEVLARIPVEGQKTRDITGGLPRVAELFEARRPKDCAVIAEMDGRVEFGRDYKNKRRIKITPEINADGVQGEAVEFLIPKGKHISVHDGDLIQKGDYIIDGNPDPHDLLRIQGVEALAEYLVNEVQEVYRLQGVPINDKHIEVIVRQMLQKVEVLDSGETTLIRGDTVEVAEAVLENQKVEKRGGRLAITQPVLLGITKASLQTRSFISAASFQETTRVLTDASVHGKKDMLEGLKENVIVGRLIPAGTGAYLRSLQKIANERDAELVVAMDISEQAALGQQLAVVAAAVIGVQEQRTQFGAAGQVSQLLVLLVEALERSLLHQNRLGHEITCRWLAGQVFLDPRLGLGVARGCLRFGLLQPGKQSIDQGLFFAVHGDLVDCRENRCPFPKRIRCSTLMEAETSCFNDLYRSFTFASSRASSVKVGHCFQPAIPTDESVRCTPRLPVFLQAQPERHRATVPAVGGDRGHPATTGRPHSGARGISGLQRDCRVTGVSVVYRGTDPLSRCPQARAHGLPCSA